MTSGRKRHIIEAQRKGEFDNENLRRGEPLILDIDSHVPAELRAGYRLLKNAGCRLSWSSAGCYSVMTITQRGIREDDPRYHQVSRQLSLLEPKLPAGWVDTDFYGGMQKLCCIKSTIINGLVCRIGDWQSWRA